MAHKTIKKSTQPSGFKAYRLFFPVAMLHAAIVLPLAVVALTTGVPQGLSTGTAHGGEMLAGYALAVMGGFLLPPLSRRQAGVLLCAWLLGRIASIAGLTGVWLILPNLLFAAYMTVLIVPRFTGAAKKWRNQATAPLVALIAGTVTAAVVLVAVHATSTARPVLYAAVTLLAGLLLFMGGRVLAPVVIGSQHRRGIQAIARLQPRVEGALLLSLIPAAAGQVTPQLLPVAACGAAAAGLLGLVRLARWRLWRCGWRADVWTLGLGYAWVCIGLVLLATHWLGINVNPILGLHVITIGGLGTLSLNVMTRTWLTRARLDPAQSTALMLGSLFITAAVLLRVTAIATAVFNLNLAAAATWSMAFVIVLVRLSRQAPTWVENHSRQK